MTTLMDLATEVPPPGPADWNDDGVAYFPGLIPDELIADYEQAWADANGYRGLNEPQAGQWSGTAGTSPEGLWVLDAERPGGWNETCPYMHQPALLDLCAYPPLAAELERLIGEPAGVHLNLTGWVSTFRNWHQDGYLNPDYVGDSYAAVWIALGNVHPDSGVFQYVRGSHRWHRLVQSRIGEHFDLRDPMWPKLTESMLTDLVEKEIVDRDAEVVDYAPQKGDVLVWHPRLYHRGSPSMLENAYRPACIAHYSGIFHRPDMPSPHRASAMDMDAGWYFPIGAGQPVR
jgi:hypothetical protein